MKTQSCMLFVVLLLGNFVALPAAESITLVGSMVGRYSVGLSEDPDQQRINVLDISLSIGAIGVNFNSLYYNCGIAERVASVTCKIPEQGYNVTHQLDTTLMYSVLADYPHQYGRWFLFQNLILVDFTIRLQNWSTQIIFDLETETDIIDQSTNSSDTITGLVNFNYRVQARYTDTSIPMVAISGLYLSGVGITVVIITVGAKKIVPEEPTCNRGNHSNKHD